MKSRFTSVKYRMLLLVLLAIIPFFGLTVYNVAHQHKVIVDYMMANSLRLAGMVSSEEKQLINVTHALLATVAQVPAVRSNDLSACNDFFVTLLSENPSYVNMGAFDPQGNMICSALPITESVNVADKPWFQNALQTGEFTIGEYQVSWLTGKDILGLLYPVMDEKGDVERIIFASLDLAWLSQHEAELLSQLPPGSTLIKIDISGIVLARQPYPEVWIGQPAPEELASIVLAQGQGVVELQDQDGATRLYSFAPVHSTLHSNDIYVILGIPKNSLFSEINRLFLVNLGSLVGITLFAILGAWFGSEIFLIRRARSFLKAAQRVSEGDFSTRTGIPHTRGEFGQMAQAFDRMADALEQREAERKEAEIKLQASETRLRGLFHSMTDVILVLDAQGRYLEIAPTNPSLLYKPAPELIGKTLHEVFPVGQADAFLGYIKRALETRQTVNAEYRLPINGSEIYFTAAISPMQGDTIIWVARDITERKQAKEEISRLSQQLQVAIDNINVWLDVLDGNANILIWNKAAEAISGYSSEEVVGHSKIWEWLYPDEDYRRKITQKAAAIIQDGEAVEDFETVIRTKTGQSKIIAWHSSSLSDSNGKVGGSIAIGRDVTVSKQHERELQAVATMSAALRTAQSRAEMLPIILDQVLDLNGAEVTVLAMRDPITGENVVELVRGSSTGVKAGLRIPMGEKLIGQVIEDGKIYLNNEALKDPLIAKTHLNGEIRAAVCLPLLVQKQVIGAIGLGRRTEITDTEIRILTAIADIAASAIHRATLHEQTEQRLRRLTALSTIDAAITSSFDLRLTLNILLEQVISQLSIDAANVLLLDPHIQTLEFAAGRGFRSGVVEHASVRLGVSYAGQVALDRKVVRIPDLTKENNYFASVLLMAGEGFITYHAVPLIAKGLVKGVLEVYHRSPFRPEREWLDFLEALAAQAAIAIDNSDMFNNLQRTNTDLTAAYDATIAGWSRALDLRDEETEGHTQRVTEMTMRLARVMGVDETKLLHIRRGALLHDIGKISIPDSILLKPSSLTDAEWERMRLHPIYAHELLSPITYLQPALDIPYCHHEKWDGTGYPRGLKGEEIPLAARIFAVVDVWDALRSDRPYRKAWPKKKALEYIRKQAGKHFDPKVVEVFLTLIREEHKPIKVMNNKQKE